MDVSLTYLAIMHDRLGRSTSVTNALAKVIRCYYDEQGNMTN